jgi:hypothetical protein
MATPFPTPNITAIHGDAVVVQVRPLVGAPNEVEMHITRNGVRETKFSLMELATVARTLQTLVAKNPRPTDTAKASTT